MDTAHDIPVRCARDRLIDLLGIGDTYPLTDLVVTVVPPKVALGETAEVIIDDAQLGVSYQLFDDLDAPLGQAPGQGSPLTIRTSAVTRNLTYRLRARKLSPFFPLPAQAARLLEATAAVKVGLDTSLRLRFKDDPPPALPLLDPGLRDPQPADPRLVPWGTSVAVQIELSQEGVEYALMLDGRDPAGAVVTGNGGSRSLATGPVHEDMLIQVRATKRFGATDPVEPKLLEARLNLKVMANPHLAVTVDGPSIVNHGQLAAIRIANSQASARYRVFVRAIADPEFVHAAPAGFTGVVVPVAGQADVRVSVPPSGSSGRPPEGFLVVGEGAVSGNGADLLLPLPPLTADTLVIVQAQKDHALTAELPVSATLPSAVCLLQAAVLLVRPDPLRALTLRVPLVGDRTGNALQLMGGQPGVYYHWQAQPSGDSGALPAYFHQRDAQDAAQNKGIGQLAMEIDFSLAGPGDDGSAPGGIDAARRIPGPPRLDIPSLPAGTRLAWRAVRAQTAVDTAMAEEAVLAELPAVRADPALVKLGEATTIRISASDARDHFQLLLAGQPVAGAEAQGGGELGLRSGSLLADTRFELMATRGAPAGLQVQRLVAVEVSVLPGTALPVPDGVAGTPASPPA